MLSRRKDGTSAWNEWKLACESRMLGSRNTRNDEGCKHEGMSLCMALVTRVRSLEVVVQGECWKLVEEVGCCGAVMGKKRKDHVGAMPNVGGGRDRLGCKVSVGAKA
ncbi:hypothetical protein PIB30_101251 [Stylosanthes scabra]|uniref:Uncharacterized protein n=1 Tax=Stylosanthes scabra TaxID=79078 RepID=A0ABU6WVL2_9FABA|nr:hypothetical protein [Stylosanthes scabra]